MRHARKAFELVVEADGDGLREQKKRQTALSLAKAALDLFLAKGYEATTIDEIAAAAGVSSRTFFRYYTTKEDVALGWRGHLADTVAEHLSARPAHEPPLLALRNAARAAGEELADGSVPKDMDRIRRARGLVMATPVLQAALIARTQASDQRLLDILAARSPRAEPARLRLALYAFNAAQRAAAEDWLVEGTGALAGLLQRVEEAFALLREVVLTDGAERPGA